jgi:hypothetical protein
MDELVKEFSLWGTLALAVMTYIATFFTRRILETAMPWLAKKADENASDITYVNKWARWYNKVLLYAIPVVFGLAWAFIPSKFLFGGIETIGGKLFWGATVGWFSGLFYKLIKATIVAIFAQKFGISYEPKDGPKGGPEEV